MPKVLKHIKKFVIKFIIYIHVYLNFKFIIILN